MCQRACSSDVMCVTRCASHVSTSVQLWRDVRDKVCFSCVNERVALT